jgi:putative flippase GtrA
MIRYWQGLGEERRALATQLIRYAITGGGVTALSAFTYWIAAKRDGPFRIAPLVANLLAYLVAVVIGYVLHSRWSFRGHGRRDNVARTTFRFMVASLISLALNSFWVWLLTEHIKGATWWPIPLMVIATPCLLFWINRSWVFD